jgi:hypothetical protein
MHELETAVCWLIGAGVLVTYSAWVIRRMGNRRR